VMLFTKASRHISTFWTVQFLRAANRLSRYRPLYRGGPWYKADLVDSYWSGEKKATQTGSVRNSPEQEEWSVHQNGVLLYKQLIRIMTDYACPIWRFAARTHVRNLLVFQSKCLRIATSAPCYVVTGKFTTSWKFHLLPTTSDLKPRDSTIS
jgi:hypothetical protein